MPSVGVRWVQEGIRASSHRTPAGPPHSPNANHRMPQPTGPGSRRKSSRVPLAISADVRIDGVVHRFTVTNLSLGGVAVAAGEALPVGAPCHVALLLDGDEGAVKCDLEGVVVRTGEGETGIAFSEVAGLESFEHLHNLLLYNASDPERIVGEFGHFLGLRRRD